MSNKFMPGMYVLQGSIYPGKTGDYDQGFEDGEVRYDAEGNAYFFEDEQWYNGAGEVVPFDPSWTTEWP